MKLLTYLFTLFFVFNAIAVAPYGIKGQSQSGTLYSNVHQFPNQQVTNLGGINALVETGNKNILVNPSFEHSTFSTGWTNSVGTFTEETAIEIDGLKAAKLVLSAQTMSLTQSSTLYASQFADGGTQGLAMVRVKSDVALKVCAIQAGVVSTSLCVDVPAHNKWGLYKVPFILGATSNGISIASIGNVTGTVYVDEGFLGAVDLKQDINVVGAWVSGTCASSWTTNTTTTCKYRQVGQNLEIQYKTAVSGSPTGSTLIYDIPTGFTIDTSKMIDSTAGVQKLGAGTANDVSVNNFDIYATHLSTTQIGVYRTTTATGTNPVHVTTANYVTTTAPFSFASGDSVNVTVTVPVTQLSGSSSVYSSTNADTSWKAWPSPTFTNLGTATPNLIYKRQGDDLLVSGYFTCGTPAAGIARIDLPVWNGSQLTVASGLPALTQVGFGSTTNSTYPEWYPITLSGRNYISFGPNSGQTILEQNGNALCASGNRIALNLRIPINGWENSNIIIGQFNGLESCTDTYECTDTYSAKVSATGIVSDENNDWITGNFSVASTNQFTGTFRASLFTVAPNCVVTFAQSPSTAVYGAYIASTSAASIRVDTNDNTNIAARAFNISCQKQGADYIGKTAKAVASDQNVRTTGVVNSQLFGAAVTNSCSTSPCSISQSFGSNITSITRASTGQYSLVLSGLSSTPLCSFNSTETSAGNGAVTCHRTSTRSSTAYGFSCKQGTAFIDYNFEVICGGN